MILSVLGVVEKDLDVDTKIVVRMFVISQQGNPALVFLEDKVNEN